VQRRKRHHPRFAAFFLPRLGGGLLALLTLLALVGGWLLTLALLRRSKPPTFVTWLGLLPLLSLTFVGGWLSLALLLLLNRRFA
jgi:hypothetical protein